MVLKAVIMAGGEGTRLRPITCGMPKPMVPVLGKPVMEYTVDLLKQHGIVDVAVTLHYLPDAIRDYFGEGEARGMWFHYFVEDVPLGTAGSVRAARRFLDEPFIVISGDALTDIDLSAAMAFHRERRAEVTIVLKSVEAPVEYGVVIVAPDGRVQRFLEKPAWSDVFSDTVNTGIYIIEPQVMDRIAEGARADFSKDLFPALMAAGARLYGYLAEGYWCDIGNPEQYAAAHFDVLDGQVRVDTGIPQRSPGVYVDAAADVSQEAELIAPCAVLAGAYIGPGCTCGPRAVVGAGCAVERGASLQGSVLLEGIRVGKAARLEGAVLCRDAVVEERARIEDGAVIGAGVRVGSDSIVSSGVSIWPGIQVEKHTHVRQSQHRGNRYPQSLFDENGISGTFNDDISAESIARLAMAIGSAMQHGSRFGVATWGDNAAALLREAFDAGLLSTGVCCVDMGRLTVPAVRFAAKRLKLDGAVHIHAMEGRVLLTLMDNRGANIDGVLEKKIEDAMLRGSFRRARNEEIAEIIEMSGISIFYEQELFGDAAAAQTEMTIGIYGPDEELNTQTMRVLEGLGYVCRSCMVDNSLTEAARHAQADRASIGLYLHGGGDEFAFIDEQGVVYEGDRLAVMLAMVAMDRGLPSGTVPLPVMANMGFEPIAEGRGVNVERTPAGRSQWLRKACYSADERMCFLFNDGAYAAICLAGTLGMERLPLSAYAARVPETYTRRQYADCPMEKRGLAMKTLHTVHGGTEQYGGAFIPTDKGRVHVVPEKGGTRLRITTEAYREEYAQELADFYRGVIDGIVQGRPAPDGGEQQA